MWVCVVIGIIFFVWFIYKIYEGGICLVIDLFVKLVFFLGIDFVFFFGEVKVFCLF